MAMKIWRHISILALLFAIAGCSARHVQAQNVLTSTTQSVWNNASCAASFISSNPVQNIGQTVHIVTYAMDTSGPVTAQPALYIQGSFDGLSYLNISDAGVDDSGTLVGFGAYPYIRLQIVNSNPSSACTVSANYMGTQVSPSQVVGNLDISQYAKRVFTGAPAGTTATTGFFFTPYGNTAGYITFSGTSVPSGSTLTITGHEGATFTYSVSTTTGSSEYFLIPSVAQTQVDVTYMAGGSSAGAITVVYHFFKTGADEHPACEKSAIINTAAAGPTQIIAAVAGATPRVCSINLSSGTAEAIDLQQGTGTNCATGNAQLTGLTHLAANVPWMQNFPNAGLLGVPGNAVCIHLSGTNQSDGTITYSLY